MTVFERISRLALGTVAALLVVLVFASGALAGEFHVYSCRMPSGQVAPTEGWRGSKAEGSTYATVAENTCDSGGALLAVLGEATTHLPNVDKASWTFVAPTAISLVAAS